MAGDRRYGLKIQILDATVPHECTVPGQIHDGGTVPYSQEVVDAMAYVMTVLCECAAGDMAGGTADGVVCRQYWVIKEFFPQHKSGFCHLVQHSVVYRCRKIRGHIEAPESFSFHFAAGDGQHQCQQCYAVYYFHSFSV